MMKAEPCEFFLNGVRFAFGLWLLYVGLVKWLVFGPTNFVGMIVGDFDKTWSPHLLNMLLAWVILVAEPLLALAVLSGCCRRTVWTLVSLLMFLLLLGQTILMKPTVGDNWHYFLLALICAALSGNEQSGKAA
jgi:hypothetical protein